MDDNKKQYGKQQIFYFNDEGELIVESNRGIWKDGEQYVKMYGNFTCNAKTLGIIINKFKGFPVVVSNARRVDYFSMEPPYDGVPVSETFAIVNPSDEDKGLLEKIERYNIRNENMNEQVKQLKEELNMHKEMSYKLQENISKFNKLPWWKRMFKKIEV